VNPPPLQIDHSCRVSVLEPELIWRLRGDVLWMRAEGGGEGCPIPLSSLTGIRLVFSPTRVQTNRYRCLLYNAGGRIATIQNEHYKGVMSFEDRTASYLELVNAVIRRTAMVNSGCKFFSGSTWLGYASSVTVLVISFALLAGVLYLMPGGISSLVVVKLLLILVYLPVAWLWIKRNKPATFPPDAIPVDLLPKPKDG
jgi:hypothetical protein